MMQGASSSDPSEIATLATSEGEFPKADDVTTLLARLLHTVYRTPA
jgi:hypothetical protein